MVQKDKSIGKKRAHSLSKHNLSNNNSLFTKDQLTDLIHKRRVDKVFASLKHSRAKFRMETKKMRKNLKSVKSRIDNRLKPPSELNPLKNEYINVSINRASKCKRKRSEEPKEKLKENKINLRVHTSSASRKTPFYGHLKVKSNRGKRQYIP